MTTTLGIVDEEIRGVSDPRGGWERPAFGSKQRSSPGTCRNAAERDARARLPFHSAHQPFGRSCASSSCLSAPSQSSSRCLCVSASCERSSSSACLVDARGSRNTRFPSASIFVLLDDPDRVSRNLLSSASTPADLATVSPPVRPSFSCSVSTSDFAAVVVGFGRETPTSAS